MERVCKESGSSESANPLCTAQAKFTSKSRESELANDIGNSPLMAAQRKKLKSLFGGAIQAKGVEGEVRQGKFAVAQVKHSLGEEEFLPGKFGVQQHKISEGAQWKKGGGAMQFYSMSTSSRIAQLMTEEKKITTKNYGTAYYQYDHDSQGNIDDFGNNRATKSPVGPNPVDTSSWVDLENVSGSGEGTMLSGKEVEIIGASRSQHFSMADNLNDTGPSDRKGTYTWHHLTPKYQMVLVDMAVHGAFSHRGGYSLWA